MMNLLTPVTARKRSKVNGPFTWKTSVLSQAQNVPVFKRLRAENRS